MRTARTPYVLAALLIASACVASAQSLYKYRGDDGEWIFSDRPPDDAETIDEVRELQNGNMQGRVTIDTRSIDRRLEFAATNNFHAPVELAIRFKSLRGIEYPDPDSELIWIVPARSRATVLSLGLLSDVGAPAAEYEFEYMVGDPGAIHRPSEPYRVPVAISTDYPVTQAYPDAITHRTPDSYHAVDIAMPIGTDVFAARGGIVFDVSSDNYKGGTDREQHGASANVVQILHDDGTFAIYAHLNWNSIRVRPGDRVRRGEYIADSGNTGFSSGPHLHFAVLRNTGLRLESLPVRFAGADRSAIVPATGSVLTAY